MNIICQKIRCAVLVFLCAIALETNAQLIITTQPQDQLNVPIGNNVRFDVQAQGSGLLTYQWRLNGVNITDETNSSFIVQNVLPQKGGSYSVAVSDQNESINSNPARLTVNIQFASMRDFLASAFPLEGPQGILRSDSRKATKEVGEPNHNGKRGGKSIWFKWVAPTHGIVTFATTGSGFDTLLAAYTGREIPSLIPVPSAIPGEDRGGFLTSLISFNVVQQEEYEIAVDGFGGTGGDVVLGWNFEPTPDSLPTIFFSPPDQTLTLGGSLTLFFQSDVQDAQASWFFNGQQTPVFGNQFRIDKADERDVGTYETRVKDPRNGREVTTQGARIQINVLDDGKADPNSMTHEKFLEAADAALQRRGLTQLTSGTKTNSSNAGGLASGYTSSQIFSTALSTKDPGEPNHCSQTGGASEWYTYQPTNSGTLQINTDGSSFNTVLAVYTGPGTDYASLVSAACNNVAGNGGDRVSFPGTSGTIYFIAVDGVGGARGTAYLNINFGDPPLIVSGPTNQIVPAGSNATFTVFASGSGPLRYRWQFNGVNILNATNSTYTVTNVQPPLTGNYTVTVSNVIQVVTSTPPAVLSLATVPVITVQPTNQSANVGSNATFSVTATGNPAPTYQWRFGLSNLIGATNSSYTRNNVQTSHAGTYSVVLSNMAGTATSSNATLTVNVPPTVTLDPSSQTSNVGATIVFTVAATGSPPVHYQWRFGGFGDILGQTNTSLTVTNVQITNAGNYRVVVTNIAGSVMSAIAVLTVNSPPIITQQPLTQTVTPGSNPALTVVATGTPTPTYQWRFNTTNLVGQISTTLTLTNFQTNNEGDYSVLVSNSVSVVTSSNATLALNAPLRIGAFSLASNAAQMQVIGIVGSNYIFQAASNLIDWSSLQTNTASNGFLIFLDTNVASFPTRTYRIQQE